MSPEVHRKSIKREISRAFTATNVTVLLIACLSFLIFDLVAYRQSLTEETITRGRIIAANSTSSLAFENQEDAYEILSALREDTQLIAAILFRNDGRIFASYTKDTPLGQLPDRAPTLGSRYTMSFLDVALAVREGNSELGTLLVRTSLSDFYNRLALYGLIASLVFCLALFTGRWISNILGIRISAPILALSETTRKVAQEKNYAVRAELDFPHAADELVQLSDHFNFMLEQIEERDISIRANEERFRTIFDFAPFGAAELDTSGSIVRSNRALQSMVGRTETALETSTLWRFSPPNDARAQRDHFEELTDGKRDHFEMEGRFLRPDGSVVWTSLAVSAIRGAEGSIKTIIAMLRDSTREKEAERALRESEENLRDLVYIASHDLQTPVVSLVGFSSQIIKQHADALSDRGRYALGRLKANAEHLHKLILSLLDLSRLNTVKNPHRKFSANAALNGVVKDLELRIREAEADVDIKNLPDLVGDESRLTSVFRNLLSNSLKYGGKAIEIGYHDSVFYVKDDGIGIAPRNLEKVFNAGVRLKSITVDGVGMGLTFCKKVIAQHGGRIWVESEGEGKGSLFKFTLANSVRSTEEPPSV